VPQSILNDILPKADRNDDISRYATIYRPVYDLNLSNPTERNSIKRLRNNMVDGVVEINGSVLANVFYYDICERQAKSIAQELIKNEEIGVEFHGALFLRLVDNFNTSSTELQSELSKRYGPGKTSEMMSEAKDIIFVQRFNSFWRYDHWEIGELSAEAAEMKKNPDRMLVSVLNQDICFGQFWDKAVLLKNDMVQESLQRAIEELQEPNAIEGVGFLVESVGLAASTTVEDRERYALRLIELVSGNVDEYSGASFHYDVEKIVQIEKKLSDPMTRMKEFIKQENQAPRSIKDLIVELEKFNSEPKKGNLSPS